MRLPAALAAAMLALVLTLGASVCQAERASGQSIYQLDAPWQDDSGQALHLRELAGNVQVLTLIYTSCTGACPVTVKSLQMLARSKSSPIGKTHFLLVTVDPQRDTLEVLRRYRRDMHLEKDGWKLLRGSDQDVRKLAAVLGFNYEQIDSGEFVHSNLITVLNARGEIVHQQNGIDADFAALKDAIQHAAIEDSQ